MKLDLKQLDQDIAQCREHVEKGDEDQSTLDWLLALRADLQDASEPDWEAYNEIAERLPKDGEDPVLVILKGQLLIEKLVRRFISLRLSNPEAFERGRFTAAQCIALAESMCLKNEEPGWLWTQVSELNTIRNKLAHSFIEEKIEDRITQFVASVDRREGLHGRSLTGAVARIYGMLKGLCDIADSAEFRIKSSNK